jgi:hypothetical protein
MDTEEADRNALAKYGRMNEPIIVCIPGQEPYIKEVPWPMTLEEMQEIVAGYIQIVYSVREEYRSRGIVGYANEEGLIHGLPFNAAGSSMAGHQIVGVMFWTGGDDGHGNDVPIPAKMVEEWRQLGRYRG